MAYMESVLVRAGSGFEWGLGVKPSQDSVYAVVCPFPASPLSLDQHCKENQMLDRRPLPTCEG